MERRFRITRAGPFRYEIATISLVDGHITVTAGDAFIESLREEGVYDLRNGRHYDMDNLQPDDAESVYFALLENYSGSSAYGVEEF